MGKCVAVEFVFHHHQTGSYTPGVRPHKQRKAGKYAHRHLVPWRIPRNKISSTWQQPPAQRTQAAVADLPFRQARESIFSWSTASSGLLSDWEQNIR